MSFAKAFGVSIEHVRPHGAMYKMAGEDFTFSCAIARAIKKYEEKYLPEMWKSVTPEILQQGHGGMDYFEFEVLASEYVCSDEAVVEGGSRKKILLLPHCEITGCTHYPVISSLIRRAEKVVVAEVDGSVYIFAHRIFTHDFPVLHCT